MFVETIKIFYLMSQCRNDAVEIFLLIVFFVFLQTPYGMSRYNPAANRPPNVRIPGQVSTKTHSDMHIPVAIDLLSWMSQRFQVR